MGMRIKIQENIRLAPYTTLQVGGNARYFAEPANEDEIVAALRWAHARSLPLFVLGGGSNLLVSDAGFQGVVLHMTLAGIEACDGGGKRSYSAGAGVNWDTLVARAVADNCAGVECLSGIPGSVGGTPVQNVGAYGQDISETLTRVCAIDSTSLQRVEFDRAGCGFGYRQSRFNGRDRGRYIVTRVDYALHPGGAPKIAYAELQRYFSSQPNSQPSAQCSAQCGAAATPTLAQTREAVLAIRRAKGMVLDENDADSRSAGSFFKNPVVSLADYERIAAASVEPVPHFEAGAGRVKLVAAWMIEQAGIEKGFALGAVAISSKHTLALINRGGATAADVLRLKELVQHRVHQRFGVELQPEPVMLGFGTCN
jgi:UDP-N-acetylmuramate dehydrogenase